MARSLNTRDERALTCRHQRFSSEIKLESYACGRYHAYIRIWCTQCGLPFSFKRLPQGIDIGGATTSEEGFEGRFAMVPGPVETLDHQVRVLCDHHDEEER